MSETCAQMPKIGSQETDATRHPRIFNAHNQDPVQLRLFTDPRVCGVVESLIGLPIAGIQSMVMFKEPGMRGQAYHQDSHYIQNTPDTLTAIWIAMEPANTENGCLHVVPGSHCDGIQTDHPITNHEEHESWTSEVSVDRDRETPVVLDTGDVLFFHGQLLHGSYRNQSADSFRRSFVSHYVAQQTHVARQDLRKLPIALHSGGRSSGVDCLDAPGGSLGQRSYRLRDRRQEDEPGTSDGRSTCESVPTNIWVGDTSRA